MSEISANDIEDDDNVDVDEVLLKQIQDFKPIFSLKNSINLDKIISDGDVIQINNESMGQSAPFDAQLDDDYNLYEEEQPTFEKSDIRMTDVTPDGKVRKSVIRFGTGIQVPENSLCRIHYSAFMMNEMEPFDSSRTRKKQHLIKVGRDGDGLVGLQYAVSSMKTGEISRFLVHPDYAFGKYGCPPRVSPNSYIIFEVELFGFIDQNEIYQNSDVLELGDDALVCTEFSKVYKIAVHYQKQANDFFYQNAHSKALKLYGKAIRIVESSSITNEGEEEEMNNFCVRMYLNVAICCMKLGKNKYGKTFCEKVLVLQPDNFKAMFRLSKIERSFGNFNRAKELLLQAAKIVPKSSEIHQELVSLQNELDLQSKMMSDFYSGMFETKEELKKQTRPSSINSEDETYITTVNRLELFLHHSTSKEIIFPDSLTSYEVHCLSQASSKLGLTFTISEAEGKPIYKVSKAS